MKMPHALWIGLISHAFLYLAQGQETNPARGSLGSRLFILEMIDTRGQQSKAMEDAVDAALKAAGDASNQKWDYL